MHVRSSIKRRYSHNNLLLRLARSVYNASGPGLVAIVTLRLVYNTISDCIQVLVYGYSYLLHNQRERVTKTLQQILSTPLFNKRCLPDVRSLHHACEIFPVLHRNLGTGLAKGYEKADISRLSVEMGSSVL